MYVHVLIKNYGQQQYCMPTKLAKRNIAVKTKELVSRGDWLSSSSCCRSRSDKDCFMEAGSKNF